ncbi:MAG: AAA family ATPase, partial [Bacteroidaceae bacterium]|nr:AAA family ATPase [Bacteroidaceae bacterium]
GKSDIQQVFVLTHNTEFHRLLSQRKRNPEVHYYKLVKRGGATRLLAYGEENPVKTEYEMQWQELRQLNEGHSVPNAQNAMRKILETYFVRLGGFHKRTIIFNIFPDNTEEQAVAKSLLKWIDEGSHGSLSALYTGDTDAVNYRYLEVFHQIFTRLGHEAHYMMMIKDR